LPKGNEETRTETDVSEKINQKRKAGITGDVKKERRGEKKMKRIGKGAMGRKKMEGKRSRAKCELQ